MKKLLILTLAIFCFYGCKSNQSGVEAIPPQNSPIVTFKNFIDLNKCSYVGEDTVFFEAVKETVPGFILRLKDLPAKDCIYNWDDQQSMSSWGLYYSAEYIHGRRARISEVLKNEAEIPLAVTLKVDGSFIKSPDKTFDLSKVREIDLEFTTAVVPDEELLAKFPWDKVMSSENGGLIHYRNRSR